MIVVTGGTGQLGTALHRLLGDRHVVLDRSTLDLDEPQTFTEVLAPLKPSTIVNCAAYTDVEGAEDDQATAFRVNADAVGSLARTSKNLGARFITVSTDYVFDGSKAAPYLESDATNPINAYGESKLAGEQLALEENPDALIVRTSWVMSGTHESFLSKILGAMKRGPIRVVDDQLGYPTFADDLAAAIVGLLDVEAAGVLHLTNSGEATWYDIAVLAAQASGIDPSGISPTTSDAYETRAKRPKNSRLGSERRSVLGVPPLPDFRPALSRAVRNLNRR